MPAPDPRRMPPARLVQLLNSHPSLGPVLTMARLRKHRLDAGFQISSDGETVDLLKYVAWLVHRRHAKESPADPAAGSFAEFTSREAQDLGKLLGEIKGP